MFRKIPRDLQKLDEKPLEWCSLDGEPGWVAAGVETLAIVHGTSVRSYEWAEFEGATWSEEKRTIVAQFVDHREPLVIVMAPGKKQRIAYVVRERIQRSIVYQEHADLPSGAQARGMVRRGRGDALFTQVLIDGATGSIDERRLEQLEESMRDVTGI
ncbi:hypothetical protein I6E29_03625 [Arcanobacterium haemolyticum]|nr:hypothetical protein [Arcanobacterium haemolyticum]